MFVQTIHDRVPGRGRFRVRGLRRSPGLKAVIEAFMSGRSGIASARANTVTGTVLVVFEPSLGHGRIAHWLLQAIERNAVKLDRRRRVSPPAPSPPATAQRTPRPVCPPPADRETPPWHTWSGQQTLAHFASDSARGLSAVEAAARLRRDGPNTLPEAEGRGGWRILWDQLNSLPNYLLGAAAGVSLLTGGVLDALVVVGVAAANAAIGYFTESRAAETIHALRRFVQPTASVVREAHLVSIPAAEVVTGDIVELKPGLYVPADCRLLKARHLTIDESMLTGESMPVTKRVAAITLHATPLADRQNMAFMGTLVTGGEGRAVVVATGRHTEIGFLQELLCQTESPETPIERQLRQLGDQLVVLCGLVCGLVFLMGMLRGHGLLTMLRSAISLAASAVPEGLPAAATINFALGIQRMKRDHVLVRRLQAIETLGALQTICLDKTGTITCNQMTVTRVVCGGRWWTAQAASLVPDDPGPEGSMPEELNRLLECCALCNEVETGEVGPEGPIWFGSSTEVALLRLAHAAGFDAAAYGREYTLLKREHRSERRLYMSTLHRRADGSRTFCVKGSPPEVMALCRWKMCNGEIHELDDLAEAELERANDRLAGQGLRVLGMAGARLAENDPVPANGDLVWYGIVAMIDPIRDGAREMIAAFHRAGINTVMITGDQSPTAYAVGTALNISGDRPLEILDSSELTAVRGKVLDAVARQVDVYSRVSPAHKLKIVRAVQSDGRVVGMTGDGINDGPALKAANIGIAMGRSGTDIAREVADVVLEEDNLETLIKAVRDGRATYTNIRKSVNFFLATNFSEVMVMSAAVLLGIGFPLNVMQLLWINIISDIFPGLALSMEAPEPDILERPPRPAGAPLFDARDYRRMTREALVMSAATLAAYGFGLARYGPGARAGALAFQSLTTGQLLHALNCRRSGDDRRRLPPNRYLDVALGGSLAMQAMTLVLPPLRRLLGIGTVGLVDLAVIAAASLVPLGLNRFTRR
jgi:Ca2+-transporting ATPase